MLCMETLASSPAQAGEILLADLMHPESLGVPRMICIARSRQVNLAVRHKFVATFSECSKGQTQMDGGRKMFACVLGMLCALSVL